jgi:phosphoenolpyruvate carboxykinase (ATP)
MKLSITRGIIDAIHSGALRDAPATADPVFGLDAITACPGVPDNVLMPRDSWADKAAYDVTARKLAGLFAHNFRQYLDKVTSAVALAGPSE